MDAPNMSPGILKEGVVIENTLGRLSENEELESAASDDLFPAFLLLLMEFIKQYWSLELRAKPYSNIEHEVSNCSLFYSQQSMESSQLSPQMLACADLSARKWRH